MRHSLHARILPLLSGSWYIHRAVLHHQNQFQNVPSPQRQLCLPPLSLPTPTPAPGPASPLPVRGGARSGRFTHDSHTVGPFVSGSLPERHRLSLAPGQRVGAALLLAAPVRGGHLVCICPSADGRLGCSHVMSWTCVQVSVWTRAFASLGGICLRFLGGLQQRATDATAEGRLRVLGLEVEMGVPGTC